MGKEAVMQDQNYRSSVALAPFLCECRSLGCKLEKRHSEAVTADFEALE